MFAHSRLRSIPQIRFEILPAVPAFVWLALGVLSVLLPAFQHTSALVSTPLTVSGALLLLAGCSGPVRKLCWFFPVGVLVAWLHAAAPWQNYGSILPRQECSAAIRAVVAQATYTGDSLEGLGTGSGLRVSLKELRLGPEGEWRRCTGRLLLRRTRDVDPPYGALVQAEGAFIVPPGARVPGGFGYRSYLRNNGMRHIFAAERAQVIGPPTGWRRIPAFAYAVRDFCADSLAAHLDSTTNRRILLAMTLGYREGLDARTRVRFLRSGAIHVFAISGLHVGIAGSLVLLFLRVVRVPFRVRCLALPPVLGLYVILAGGAPSAVRAWLMLSIWSVAASRFRPTAPLNTVAVAGLVLLLVNPFNLIQTGFQFSFLIVTVLVLGWPLVSRAVEVATERKLWVPLRLRRFHRTRRCWAWSLRLGSGSVLAWLGSAGLIAWANCLVIPAALLVNVGLGILAWLTLFMACPKTVAGMLPLAWPSVVVGRFMNLLLGGIQTLAELGSRGPGCLAVRRPEPWLVVAYYVCLLAGLMPRAPRRFRATATAAALALLLCPVLYPGRSRGPRCVVVCSGTSPVPAIIVEDEDPAVPPTVLHSGAPESARCVAEWLKSQGHDTIDRLILPSGQWSRAGGAAILVDSIVVRSLAIPASPRSVHLRRAARAQRSAGRRIRLLERSDDAGAAGLQLDASDLVYRSATAPQSQTFELCRRAPESVHDITLTVMATGQVMVSAQTNGGNEALLALEPSSALRVIEMPLQGNAGSPDREGAQWGPHPVGAGDIARAVGADTPDGRTCLQLVGPAGFEPATRRL